MSKSCPEESYALLEHRWKKDIPTGFTIYDKKIADEKMFYKMCNIAIDRAVATTNFVNNVNVNEKYISAMLKRIGMDEDTGLKVVSNKVHLIEYDEELMNGNTIQDDIDFLLEKLEDLLNEDFGIAPIGITKWKNSNCLEY